MVGLSLEQTAELKKGTRVRANHTMEGSGIVEGNIYPLAEDAIPLYSRRLSPGLREEKVHPHETPCNATLPIINDERVYIEAHYGFFELVETPQGDRD